MAMVMEQGLGLVQGSCNDTMDTSPNNTNYLECSNSHQPDMKMEMEMEMVMVMVMVMEQGLGLVQVEVEVQVRLG